MPPYKDKGPWVSRPDSLRHAQGFVDVDRKRRTDTHQIRLEISQAGLQRLRRHPQVNNIYLVSFLQRPGHHFQSQRFDSSYLVQAERPLLIGLNQQDAH